MKHLYMKLFLFLFVCSGLLNYAFAQAPEGIIYQAEARDDKGKVLLKANLEVKITIHQDNLTGISVWEGLHHVSTNDYGMFSLVIGEGTSFDVFEDIEWAEHLHFLNIQVKDPKTLVWVDMGTTQLLSVPYALHAKTAGETDPVYTSEIMDAGSGAVITDDERMTIETNAIDIAANSAAITDEINRATAAEETNATTITTKVDKETGKGLSTNDYTNDEKSKLQRIEEGAEVNVKADWDASEGDEQIVNKPTTLEGYGIIDASTKAYVDALAARIEALEGGPVEMVTDIDGNTYKTVRIGTQVWMAENLKTSKYNDETTIINYPHNSTGISWYDCTSGAFKIYDDTFGFLYNWHAVGTNKLCPIGWHVPSDSEWKTLADFLGGWEIAGGKLKEVGTSHWKEPNTGATNESGFRALPGLSISFQGDTPTSEASGFYGFWWTSTDLWLESNHFAYYRGITYESAWFIGHTVLEGNSLRVLDTENGLSVRCVRD